MRILHVLDHGLPLHSGYAFRTRALIKAQQRAGHEVAAVTGARQGASEAAEDVVDGIHFFRTVPPPPRPPVLREIGEVAALTKRIAQVAEDFRPDVLHAHSPVLSALAARRIGIPLLYEIRGFWEDAAVADGRVREGGLRYTVSRWLETRACRSADAVAVICQGLRQDLLARGIPASKIMVSPNGVDLDLFGAPPPRDAALAAELGLDGRELIGFAGSFYDYEGLDLLIAAMPRLLAARPDAALLLVGGGPMADALAVQAAGSPARDRIRFVGRVPHDKVERYYSLIDVMAYPRKAMRLTELVTPLKPLEAMAQRRLVAASDIGGHRELIEDGVTGTLFAPDDPAALADALAALLADRSGWAERRATARGYVEAERDWARIAKRYDPVYARIAARADFSAAKPLSSLRA